jgi:ATP-binding cassette subfamily B protein
MTLAVYYFIVIILIGVCDFMKEAILALLGQKITREIRYDMMRKLTKLNHGYFTANGTGVTVSRFMNDVDAITSMFSNGIVGMLIDCFKIIGIVISIWMFQARLGGITILLLPFITLVTRYFQKKMLKAQIENRILVGKLNNHIGESMKNIMTVKAFNKEYYMEQKYSEYLSENYKTVEKVNFYDSIFPPIIQITRAFVIGLIVVLAVPQLDFLGITVGMAAASIDLISNLFAPVEALGMEFQNIQQAISGVRRVDDFLRKAEDDEKDQSLTPEVMIPEKTSVVLEFLKTSFRYEASTDILRDITLRINPGEKVVFIGRTGVGKTTLFKLVLGLLKPTGGSITVNGTDVYQIPNSMKRQIFGYVDQSFWVLHATVAEQISLQDKTITREQIEQAISFVGMADYVGSLENGLETVANDTMFSQGQKQLLAIARAIVTDPPVLLLDEITANLDSITEERIINVLQKAGKDRILLTITHRLSSISDQDTVVVLEKGRIKTSGKAEQLKQKDDWYRSHLELENLTWS